MRAGDTVLSLIAEPLCVPTLRAHLEGSLRLPELHERLAIASQTSLRGQVEKLRGVGALERQVRPGMPYTVENELTDAGREILAVAEVVEGWLSRFPQGPLALGSEPAKAAIRALVGGWKSMILRALAVGPLSLTELDGVIVDISYPSIERRLSAMRAAGQIGVLANGGRGKPYAVTEWARRAVGPVVTARRCERFCLAELTDPLTQIEIETGVLLAVPLVSLPDDLTGSCLLAVGTDEGDVDIDRPVAGVHVEIEGGRVASCVLRLDAEPHTWALGTVDAWVDAIVDGQFDGLRVGGGKPVLAEAITAGLHAVLGLSRTRRSR